MAAFLDNCRFVAGAAGTADWSFGSPVGGCQPPAAAGAVNGTKYKFRADSADLTQWEIAEGVYTAATASFARTSVLYNSAATGTAAGQSGAGGKINFVSAPQVAVIGLKEDLISIEEANSFTAAQQAQARSNIAAAATPALWTRSVLTVGAGTYVTKAGCRAILVHVIGGGGGGGGGGSTSAGATGGGSGGASSFGSSLLTAAGGGASQGGLASGGGASGGDLNVTGAWGMMGIGDGVGLTANAFGGSGGSSRFGGGGAGGYPGISGIAATAFGAGGGGGGGPTGGPGQGGSGGAAAGYCERLIANPAASYAWTVGVGGNGGGGSGGLPGGTGGPGIIIINEYY